MAFLGLFWSRKVDENRLVDSEFKIGCLVFRENPPTWVLRFDNLYWDCKVSCTTDLCTTDIEKVFNWNQ